MTKTLLAVEDDGALRRLMVRTLTEHEPAGRAAVHQKPFYRVLEAADADSALALLRAGPVDLVLLDLHLPPRADTPEEGLKLEGQIRELRKGILVVVVTANENAELGRELLGRGVRRILHKPLKAEELVEAVEEIFQE